MHCSNWVFVKATRLPPFFPIAWTEDGRIVFSCASKGIYQIAARGGRPTALNLPKPQDRVGYQGVTKLPNTDALLVVERLGAAQWTLALHQNGKSTEVFTPDDGAIAFFAYAPSGHLLFTRRGADTPIGDIWGLPFDVARLEVTGEPFLVIRAVGSGTVSSDGTLAYRRTSFLGGAGFTWFGLDGSTEPIIEYDQPVLGVRPSPDGRFLAFGRGSWHTDLDACVLDTERGTQTVLAPNDPAHTAPLRWLPDGKSVLVFKTRNFAGDYESVILAADGSGPVDLGLPENLVDFTQDLSYGVTLPNLTPESNGIAYAVDLKGDAEPIPLPGRNLIPTMIAVRPTGDLLAYQPDSIGSREIYLTRFPSAEGRWRVSLDGGTLPTWSADGKTLYFASTRKGGLSRHTTSLKVTSNYSCTAVYTARLK